MKIEANNEIDTNGFALACHLDGINMQQVLRKFPDAEMLGYEDEEKGYSGIEAGFSTPAGNFYVYARFGSVRIGCIDGWNNAFAEVWKEELLQALQG